MPWWGEGPDKLSPERQAVLPAWLRQCLSDARSNLSTDVAMRAVRQQLSEMAQPSHTIPHAHAGERAELWS